MGRAKFKIRDRNRYRKTYAYMRRRPVWEYMAGKETIWETGAVTFTGQHTVTHQFLEEFPAVPSVTLTACDDHNGDGGIGATGVNVYIDAVDTERVVIAASEAFTGTVHLNAVYIKEGQL